MKQGKIIRREDVLLWKSGKQALEDASGKADAMLSAARERAVAEEARAYADGLERAVRSQALVMTQTVARRDAYLADVETEVVTIVINAVRKIFSEFDDSQRVGIIVGKALRSMRNQSHASIRIHPSQYDKVKSMMDDFLQMSPGLQSLSLEGDSRIKPGSCIFSSDIGMVEVDLEAQIRNIECALMRGVSAVEIKS